jgi:pimeloyl-ACP methyl ester carboxylesterase
MGASTPMRRGPRSISRAEGEAEADVTIDIATVARLRRYEEPELGISESFAETLLGPSESFAVVTLPSGEIADTGFVFCPSLGVEQGHLRRLEALTARKLAAKGFPVVRIRPNPSIVDGSLGAIDLTTRLREVEEAVDLLRNAAGPRQVGLVGALFGGTVSALACERLDLSSLVLVDPVVRGKQYMRDALRRHAIAELIAAIEEGGGSASQRPLDELAANGWTSIRGLRLTSAEFDAISAVDLLEDVRSFRGRSLLVGITPSGNPRPGLRRLADHLEALGGEPTVEVLTEALPVPFGEFYFAAVGSVRVDTRLELDQRLTEMVVGWAVHMHSGAEQPLEAV